MNQQKFIIFADKYNDDSGGTVVLHQLCHLLNKRGYCAYLWPAKRPVFDCRNFISSMIRFVKYFRKRRLFATNSSLDTPVAKYSDLKDSIVVYPEIVYGNPLKAQKVVRWLLHKSGYHRSTYLYGKDELFFYYLKAYDDPSINSHPDNLLYINMLRDDVYRQQNYAERDGSCYILRKGKHRSIVHDLNDSILIDGLSHEECANIFNKVKYCISYDTYTMYSVYAVLCGCISIIIPEEGLSKTQWMPNEEDRYGLSYGFDDVESSITSRKKLFDNLKNKEKEMWQNIDDFTTKCDRYFNN